MQVAILWTFKLCRFCAPCVLDCDGAPVAKLEQSTENLYGHLSFASSEKHAHFGTAAAAIGMLIQGCPSDIDRDSGYDVFVLLLRRKTILDVDRMVFPIALGQIAKAICLIAFMMTALMSWTSMIPTVLSTMLG